MGSRAERGKGRSSIATGPPNLGSEAAFPQLNGGSRATFMSQNLDVQRAEKLTYHPIPKDKLVFTDEDVTEAKKKSGIIPCYVLFWGRLPL